MLAVLIGWANNVSAQCVHVQDVSGSISNQAPQFGRMIYHAALGKMLVYDAGLGTQDFWAYDGTGWTALPTPPFPARASFAWVYDSTRNVGLLFGGSGAGAPELWSYDGQWHQLTWTGTSPPHIAGGPWGAFDPNRGRAIFLLSPTGSEAEETWEWTGSGWEQGGTFGPAYPDDFTFDSWDNVGLLTGSDTPNVQTVWYYHPGATAAQGNWQQQPFPSFADALVGAPLAYDPFRHRIFRCTGRAIDNPLQGFTYTVDTWDFAATNWTTSAYSFPSYNDARVSPLCAYDYNRDKLIIAGGSGSVPDGHGGYNPVNFNDTWEDSTDEPGIAGASQVSVAHCAGDMAVFSVTPVNGSVQWYHNAVLINGATSSLLALNNLSTNDAGNYVARVQNSCGYFDSPISYLHVDVPITIFRPSVFPDCSLLCPGGALTIFPLAPVNTGIPLNLHLQKNFGSVEFPSWSDVRVSSPSAPTNFIFNNVQKDFSGDYRFYIDGSTCPGLVENPPWHIQVGFDIVSQPQSLTGIQPCGTVAFSVVTSGGCALTYQWYKYPAGQPLHDDGHYVGANTPTLTIAGVHYDDEAQYGCQIVDTNQCNNAAGSSLATLKLTLPQWVLRTTNGPSARFANAMAYDSARGVTVMYSGGYVDAAISYTGYGDLWEWDGSRWHQRTTYNWTNAWHQNSGGYWVQNYGDTPAARLQHAMAYDSRRGRVVMFGGRGSNGHTYGDYQFNDTWEWDGTRWYFRTTNGPPATFDHHMGYDPIRGVTVLYGGFYNTAANVWEWDGTNWTSIPATNGPATNYYQDDAALVYDTYLGTLFGGPTTSGYALAFYWTWDGYSWHPRQLGFGPFGDTPTLGTMVYDSYRYRSFHYGGQDNANYTGGSTSAYYDSASDTWSMPPDEVQTSLFVPTDFINATNLVSKLSAQADPVSQYLWNQFDTNSQQTLTNPAVTVVQKQNTLAGVLDNVITNLSIFDTNRFAAVPLSTETVVFKAVNPQGRDQVRFNRLLVEDAYPAEIGRSISTPPGRTRFGMAFDGARRCAVVMGGYYGGTGLNPLNGSDTWELMYLEGPVINDQPASQYRAAGDTAVFSVNAKGPAGSTLAYAWYLGAVPLTDGGRISGAHSATLNVANISASDAGQYRALVSDGCGSIYTAPAILTTNARLQIFLIKSGEAQLIWYAPNLILEQADVITGPWSPLPGATSPLDLMISNPEKFFRLNTNSAAGP